MKKIASDKRAGGFSDALVDKLPDFGSGDKRSMLISATTVMRRREPTNPRIASKMTNMVFDHSQQLEVWPDGGPALIEASQMTGDAPYKTMNKSGHPFALVGNFVGGAPDTRGNPYGKKGALRGAK